jgi:hypothetical protein
MRKLFLFALLVVTTNLIAQEEKKPTTSSSLYLGVNYSGMKSNKSLAGFAIGIQSLVRDTHLLAFELNHLVNTHLNFYAKRDEIKSETNYEITYGQVLLKTDNQIKFILQSGLRIENLICQMKYAYSPANAPLFDVPVYIKKSLWQLAIPLKLTVFRQGKYTGNSLGIYACVGRYTDLGIRFTVHFGK